MARTPAEDKAIKKYLTKFELIQIRVPQGEKDQIAAHAKEMGESLNSFVKRAISEAIEKDNADAKKP